jgi:hypothetical protein
VALAIRSAPLVDIGLTSTMDDAMDMAVTTPSAENAGLIASGSTSGVMALKGPVA